MIGIAIQIQPMQGSTVTVQPNLPTVVQFGTPPVTLIEFAKMGVQGLQGPPGPPGASSVDIVFNEIPSGLKNGANATFTTAYKFEPGKIQVFINGLLQNYVTEYQTTGTNTILFNESPQPVDTLSVNYVKNTIQ